MGIGFWWDMKKGRRTSAPKPPTRRASEYPGSQSQRATQAGPPSRARSRACLRRVLPVVETMEDLEASRWVKDGGDMAGIDCVLYAVFLFLWGLAAGTICFIPGCCFAVL